MRERINTLKAITKASDRTGWMIDDVAFLLYALIKFYRPSLVIQIGHLWGKSAIVILEALHDAFLYETALETGRLSGDPEFLAFTQERTPPRERGRLISVDAYPYGAWQEGIAYLQQCYEGFEFVVTASERFWESRVFPEERFILGVVDGDHSYEGCRADILGMARVGAGLIVVDDTLWIDEIDRACRDCAAETGMRYINLAAYNGVGLLLEAWWTLL
jgi:hypothetical protein